MLVPEERLDLQASEDFPERTATRGRQVVRDPLEPREP